MVLNGSPRPTGKSLQPLLKLAVLSGAIASVSLHIRRGDDINATDDLGRTPLMLAASRGHIDVCKILLDSGADPLMRDIEGNDAVSIVTGNGCTEIAALLRQFIDPAPDFLERRQDKPNLHLIGFCEAFRTEH